MATAVDSAGPTANLSVAIEATHQTQTLSKRWFATVSSPTIHVGTFASYAMFSFAMFLNM